MGLLALSACSSFPSWTKPWTWFGGSSTPQEAPSSQPYPKLSAVPAKPQVTPDEERKKLMQGLVADRTNAVHTDEVLRAVDPDKPYPISPGVIALDFAAGSSKVEADAGAKLSTLAGLQKEGGGKIRIVGHSGDEPVKAKDDAARKLEYFDLSMRRAQAVSAELLRLGVPGDALIVEGRGDDDGPSHKVDVSLQ